LKVEALGLNRAEIMFRNGAYLEAPKLPARLGYEAAGIIDAVGPGVTAFQPGDRVSTIPAFSQNSYGVYGESAIVPAYAVARYPTSLTPVEGASIWMQYLTAWGGLLHYGRLASGQSVLITAASSSVGLAAIQMARLIGATPIAVTRTSAKKQALLDFGAAHVIASAEEDLPAAVRQYTGSKGVDLVFDPIAGPFLETLAEAAAAGSQLIEYGALSPEPTPFPLFTALSKGLTVRAYTLFEIMPNPELKARAEHYIFEQL
jgi:NADPH:quinone reductase-like Zn-dependent oxidoreductase